MSDKIADIFYKKKGQKKPTYIGALWEGKYAEEQRAEGKEPWLDLNLSIMDGERRVYATEIRFGSKVLKLGKEAGIFPKVGLCEGFAIGTLDEDDFEDTEDEDEETEIEEEDAEEEELPAPPRKKAPAKKVPARKAKKAPVVEDDEDDDTDVDDL